MVRGKRFSHYVLCWFYFNYSLFSGFWRTQCWHILGGFASFANEYISRVTYCGVSSIGLTSSYYSCSATLMFPFRLRIPKLLIFWRVKTLSQHSLSRICIDTSSKTVSYLLIILEMSDLIFFSVLLYTSYLHTLIVCRPILLLILITLIRLCVCFLMMWLFFSPSILPSDASNVILYDYQLGRQRNLFKDRNPNFLV